MGNAFTAVADDANAPLYNPAGAAGAPFQIALTRATYFSGLTGPLVAHDAAFLAAPLAGGSIRAGAASLTDSGGVFRETTLLVGYALRLTETLQAGAAFKRLQAGVDDSLPDVVQNPYFADAVSSSAFTLDVGALAEPANGWTVGIAGMNLIPADLTFRESPDKEADRAPAVLRIGTALRLKAIAAFAEQEAVQKTLERSLIAADAAFGNGTAVGIGTEIGFTDAVAARVGYRIDGGKYESAGALTAGAAFAFRIGELRAAIDYAVDFSNNELEDNSSQRVSIRARF